MFVVRCCFSVSLVAEPPLDWARNASISSVPHERFRVPGFVQVLPLLMLTGFDGCVAGENNPKGLEHEPAKLKAPPGVSGSLQKKLFELVKLLENF